MKRVLLLIAGLILVLAVIVIGRTLMVGGTSEQAGGERTPIAVDADAVAERLGAAVRFRTISAQEGREADRGPFIAFRDWLAATYPKFHATAERRIVGDYSLLFAWKGSNPDLEPVLLMSHFDVVPIAPGTEAAWEQPPFSGAIADGFIWGRGTIDNKGTIIAMLDAAEQLIADGFQPERTILFAFGHDEEVGGPQGNTQIAALLKSEGVRLAWVADEGGVVGEGLLPGVSKPVALIGIAEKGYVSLRLTAHAKGGHSSMPPQATAIGRLARAIDRLQNRPFDGEIEGPTRQMLDAIAPATPFVQRMAIANSWLFEPLIRGLMEGSPSGNAQLRTTIAPTIIEGGVKENVLPDTASVIVNFRVHPRDEIADVVAHVKAAIEDPDVDVEISNAGREASIVSGTGTEGFHIIANAARAALGDIVVAPNLVVGGTDSRHYAIVSDDIYRFIPIRMGPDDTARFHGTNERVSVANLKEAVIFYGFLIRDAAR